MQEHYRPKPNLTKAEYKDYIQLSLCYSQVNSLIFNSHEPILLAVFPKSSEVFIGKGNSDSKYWSYLIQWRYGNYFFINVSEVLEINNEIPHDLTKIRDDICEKSIEMLKNLHLYQDNMDDGQDYMIRLENGYIEDYSQL